MAFTYCYKSDKIMTLKRFAGWILAIASILIGSYIFIKISSVTIFFSAVGIAALIIVVLFLIFYLLE